jgi:ATP-dependent Lon protease
MRVEPDGSCVRHADLSHISPLGWSEMTVDGRGNVYVNAVNFDFAEFDEVLTSGKAPGKIALVRPDGEAREVANELAFPNGMVVTPDNQTLVVAESFDASLTAFDIADDGTLSNRRVWADGVGPDGICLDAEGCIWASSASMANDCAREGGDVLERIDLGRPCFATMLGGPDRRTLFMLTADWHGTTGVDDVIQTRTDKSSSSTRPRPGPVGRNRRDAIVASPSLTIKGIVTHAISTLEARRVSSLLLVPLEDVVVFPNMDVTLTVDVSDDDRVLLIPRHGNDFARVGTVAEVVDRVRLPGGARAVALSGLHRGVVGHAYTDPGGRLRVEVEELPDENQEVDVSIRELEREYRATVEEILELRGDDGRISSFLRSITEPGALADSVGYAPDFTFEQKVDVLEAVDLRERLELAVRLQRERLAEMQVRKRIRDDVESGAQKQQREYILRRQMESIRKELGEDGGSVVEEYRTKIEEAGMPEDVGAQAERELTRLEAIGEQSPEASIIRTYLDWLLAVPWAKRSEERLDPVVAREVLDADHAGLEDVKDRIVEYLAVRKLRQERGIQDDRRSGAILTLIGPPGTGKTSVGESIARALGREFVRMSLGGVRDEAEIRGHRRTYIGALPGRLVRALRDAGTMNPVIMLDEVDKVGADWRGDPSAALLEVLDPAQNHSFRDHYLDVELDLSEIVFIATANIADTIPGPLLDRMEVIRFDGYTVDEKIAIARGYLWPRQRERNGLREDEVGITDDVLELVITEYTREAGVRQLERELGTILRKIATRIASAETATPVLVALDEVRDALGRQKFFQEAAERTAVPGVATGLAVTGTGGDVLFVEATAMPGKDEQLLLTGQLGDVMKESARIALSYVRAHAEQLGIDESAFEGRAFHVHVPAGAIPKDGPSAGITMTTALASLLSDRPVKHTVGMTGEVTLQGRVLPIGGLKQKVLAAHAAGLTDVILPERNRPDLDDLPERVREEMAFHPVMSLGEVLELALEPARDASLSTV